MKRKMTVFVLVCVVLLGSGCSLIEVQEQSSLGASSSYYWDGPVQNFTSRHVLSYFQQLRTLSDKEVSKEAKRVSKSYAKIKRPVDGFQYLLIMALKGANSKEKHTMEDVFADLKANTSFMATDVQELLFVIEAVASSSMASHLHNSSAKIDLQKSLKEKQELEKQLAACVEQSQTLANQIQKLKDIERILTDRSSTQSDKK